MPELPEVEAARRGVELVALGKHIVTARATVRRITHPSLSSFAARLRGKQIMAAERSGKFLILHLKPQTFLVLHFGMTGWLQWASQNGERPRHTRAVLRLEDGSELRFVDVRTLGGLWTVNDLNEVQLLTTMGPDALSNFFSLEYLKATLSQRTVAIKTALLNQRIVSGIGNIYADEILWRARVHPAIASGHLGNMECDQIVRATRQVLQLACKRGGGVEGQGDFWDLFGSPGTYQPKVSRREDKPCPHCKTPIERIVLGGRASHFCPVCQPCG